MPLHFGKIGATIALLTVIAFVLWLAFGSLWTGETADEPADTGMLSGGTALAAAAPAPLGFAAGSLAPGMHRQG